MILLKKVSPAALIALKEALAAIYWYKKDLRSFITYTIKNTAIVATIDWQNSIKYHAASELVDRMAARPDLYHDDLLALFREVANFVDFSHLKRCEDPEQKICNAQEKVEALQTHVKGYLDLLKEKEKVAERREATRQKRVNSAAFKKKLEGI